MRVVLLGGAPGIGKTTTARALLDLAAQGARLVQWVDVDALWLHQPWRVDDAMRTMVQANLRAVMANADTAGVEVLVVTWVFQNEEMQSLVRGLAPPGTQLVRVQLVADESAWRARFTADGARPPIDEFFLGRYRDAQRTSADHRVDTTGLDPRGTAAVLVELLAG